MFEESNKVALEEVRVKSINIRQRSYTKKADNGRL